MACLRPTRLAGVDLVVGPRPTTAGSPEGSPPAWLVVENWRAQPMRWPPQQSLMTPAALSPSAEELKNRSKRGPDPMGIRGGFRRFRAQSNPQSAGRRVRHKGKEATATTGTVQSAASISTPVPAGPMILSSFHARRGKILRTKWLI